MNGCKDPEMMAEFLGIDEEKLAKLTPEELEEYFRQRLKDQTERHDGGNRWIGTGGTSPVGHSGYHPGGMRVGGRRSNKSAVKVATGKAVQGLHRGHTPRAGPDLGRHEKAPPHDALGPKDSLNIEKTIYETMKNAGEIEIVFDRSLKDKLKVILMIDNGGFSMDPYINVVQVLFNHAKTQFKDLKIFYFHNTIYSRVWEDSSRQFKPVFLGGILAASTRRPGSSSWAMPPWRPTSSSAGTGASTTEPSPANPA